MPQEAQHTRVCCDLLPPCLDALPAHWGRKGIWVPSGLKSHGVRPMRTTKPHSSWPNNGPTTPILLQALHWGESEGKQCQLWRPRTNLTKKGSNLSIVPSTQQGNKLGKDRAVTPCREARLSTNAEYRTMTATMQGECEGMEQLPAPWGTTPAPAHLLTLTQPFFPVLAV